MIDNRVEFRDFYSQFRSGTSIYSFYLGIQVSEYLCGHTVKLVYTIVIMDGNVTI